MKDNIYDARGLSCPEPVLIAKDALAANKSGGFSVLVSNTTSRNNVVMFLENNGLKTNVKADGDDFIIEAGRK